MIGGSAGLASEWRETDETASGELYAYSKEIIYEKEWTGSPGDP
jgi:hypothetical protein